MKFDLSLVKKLLKKVSVGPEGEALRFRYADPSNDLVEATEREHLRLLCQVKIVSAIDISTLESYGLIGARLTTKGQILFNKLCDEKDKEAIKGVIYQSNDSVTAHFGVTALGRMTKGGFGSVV